jgi:hypothetical protein
MPGSEYDKLYCVDRPLQVFARVKPVCVNSTAYNAVDSCVIIQRMVPLSPFLCTRFNNNADHCTGLLQNTGLNVFEQSTVYSLINAKCIVQ